jgi:hypothetical protein
MNGNVGQSESSKSPKGKSDSPQDAMESKLDEQVCDMTLVISQRRVQRFLQGLVDWMDIWEITPLPRTNLDIKPSEVPRDLKDRGKVIQFLTHLSSKF